MHILHIVGSPENQNQFDTSLIYARTCEKYSKYDFSFLVVLPGGSWCFPKNLDDSTIEAASKMQLHDAIRSILSLNPDAAICHLYCQDGHTTYRGLFEILGIPILGPTSKVATICKDKALCRSILEQAGLPMPRGHIIPKDEARSLTDTKIGYPCIVKSPFTEDSIATYLVHNKNALTDAINKCLTFGNEIVIEKFIKGREVRSGVFQKENGDPVFLPVIEYNVPPDSIRTLGAKFPRKENGEIDLETKHSPGRSWFLDPTKDSELIAKVKEMSLKAFHVFDCRDFALFDIRVDNNGMPFFLEANLFCSYSPQSVLCVMAKQIGLTTEEFLRIGVQRAKNRKSTRYAKK